MRILYIYKDYKKRRKSYGKMMERCGHKVIYLEVKKKQEKNQIKIDQLKKNNYDLVWIFNPAYVANNKEAIDYIRSQKKPIVMYNTYSPAISYLDWMSVWNKIDYLFVHNIDFYKFLKDKKLNAYYMPIGFYPEQYYKSIAPKKKYNVTFCGTCCPRDTASTDKRAKYIRQLADYNIVVYGKAFEGKVGKVAIKDYKTHNEQRIIYSKSKVNLDLPFFHKKPKFYRDKYHIKNRFFEIPATGNFLLTVRCPEFLDIFDEDTIGYYDDNKESLKENVKKYLKDNNLRKKMAQKSYDLVSQKHTFLHRFKEMFEIIER
jgi:hypothetical protein